MSMIDHNDAKMHPDNCGCVEIWFVKGMDSSGWPSWWPRSHGQDE